MFVEKKNVGEERLSRLKMKGKCIKENIRCLSLMCGSGKMTRQEGHSKSRFLLTRKRTKHRGRETNEYQPALKYFRA